MENFNKNSHGLLSYLLDNCIFAYEQLCKINKELAQGMNLDSSADVNYIGGMDRMIKDYLVVRVYGLFDGTQHMAKGGIDEVMSFEKIFSENEVYKSAKKEEIIKYITNKRHNFVAHTNQKFDVPDSLKICNSNLKEILLKLKTLVS
jgi:hypothetical protein